jgi:hypothetical protein
MCMWAFSFLKNLLLIVTVTIWLEYKPIIGLSTINYKTKMDIVQTNYNTKYNLV